MEDDRAFYERRLQEELARAASQGDAGLRALHWRWATLYRDRLAQLRGGAVNAAGAATRAMLVVEPARTHP